VAKKSASVKPQSTAPSTESAGTESSVDPGKTNAREVRVVHVVVGGDIGGAERLLVDLATRNVKTGAQHSIAVITPNRALVTYFENAGLRVHDRGPARENPLAYLALSLGRSDTAWLSEIIEQEKADIVHTHTFASHVIGTRAAGRTKRPQLRTEHHVMHYLDPSTMPFTRWAAAKTEAFVAVSEYVKRTIIDVAPSLADRIQVVRNGVDTAYFKPDHESRKKDRPIKFAIVCRLTGWKRVQLAVQAASLANVHLVVVGDGEDRKKLEGIAHATKANVEFVGQQKDPRPFVLDCDATISTARDEPLGLSVLESLAMERPVVAIRGGGIPEIVDDDRTGFLVQEPTAHALAHTLKRVSRDRDRLVAMGKDARAAVLATGTIERMCEGYARVYRSLLEPG
jgi:glycosyltransferase involved in cell wall biosynthesis